MARTKFGSPHKKEVAKTIPSVKYEFRGKKLMVPKRICNKDKWNLLGPLFDRVCSLKNEMSTFLAVRGNEVLMDHYNLVAKYKHFDTEDLNAWECQALFQDIVGDYRRALGQGLKARPFALQESWSYATYQRAVSKVLVDGTKASVHEV